MPPACRARHHAVLDAGDTSACIYWRAITDFECKHRTRVFESCTRVSATFSDIARGRARDHAIQRPEPTSRRQKCVRASPRLRACGRARDSGTSRRVAGSSRPRRPLPAGQAVRGGADGGRGSSRVRPRACKASSEGLGRRRPRQLTSATSSLQGKPRGAGQTAAEAAHEGSRRWIRGGGGGAGGGSDKPVQGTNPLHDAQYAAISHNKPQ